MGRTSYALLGASLLVSALSIDTEARGGGGKSGGGGGGKSGGGGGKGAGSSSSEESSLAAQFYGLCVDSSLWEISQDGVDGTYTEMYGPTVGGRTDGWSSVTGFNVDTITADTVLKVHCVHSGPRMLEDNGLFIGSISYNGADYYTSNPMSDSLWEVIDSSISYFDDTPVGSLDMSVYCPKSGASVQNECLAWDPTGDEIDGPETKSVIKGTWTDDGNEHINENANWVWNDASENMLTFQFRFSRVIGDEAEAIPSFCTGECTWRSDECISSITECNGECNVRDDIDECYGNEAEATGQVMAALVASWQTAKALEWSSSVTLLVVAAFLVALLYAVNECTKNKKDSAYLPIAAGEAC